MGKVMVKKIKGMNVMAKVSLVLLFTLLTSLFMQQGWYKPKSSEAAIATTGWTTIYNSATYPSATSVAYPTDTGAYRMLVVAISSDSTAVGTQSYTVSWGGQTLIRLTGDETLATARQHTALYYLNDAGIAAATGSNFSLTVTGGTSHYTTMYAAVYNGVDQAAPGQYQTYNSITSTVTSPVFTTSLTENSGDQPIVIVNSLRTGSTSSRSISGTTNWTTPANGDQAGGSTDALRSTVLTRSIPVTATSDTSPATISSSTLASMTGVSLKAGPVLSAASPTSGAPGTTFDVILTGTNLATPLSVSFGADITVNTAVLNNSNSITANVTIAASPATSGDRRVTVTDAAGSVTANIFSISDSTAPAVASISPAAVGQGGSSVNLAITGSNFSSGASVAFSGSGISVNSVTVNSSTSLTANVTIDAAAATGVRDITVTSSGKSMIENNAFTVNAAPTATAVTSASKALGWTGYVTVTGTGFVSGSGLTAAFSGTGITVNSTTWVSATSLIAGITIANNAPVGARTVTVTNPDFGTTTSATSLFTVYDSSLAPTISSITPDLYTGSTSVPFSITGTNLASGSTVTISGTGVTIDTGSLAYPDSNHITGNITVTAAAATGDRTVTVTCPDTQVVTRRVAITTSAMTVTAAAPSIGVRGGSPLNVVLTGTGFVSGATVSFSGTGITVISTTFTSATSITANISVASDATTGANTVKITNPSTGSVSSATIFKVYDAAPTVTALLPGTVGQGATAVPFTITGTNFVSGATVTFSGTNVTVDTGSLLYPDSTHITGTLSVSGTATAGARTVTVTLPDTQSVTSTATVTVMARPTVSSAAPVGKLAGSAASNVVLTGTGFVSGATVSFSGTGITVNSTTFTSATSLTANITVDAGATIGARTLTVTNPDKGTSAGTTFAVYAGSAPTVTAISPTAVGQGATLVPFTITGTNFVSGATVTFGGSNVTVDNGSLTYPDATHISGTLTVGTSATVGARTIIVTLPDTQTVTSTSLLTVVVRPVVTTANPTYKLAGATASVVTLTGTGFASGATVSFSGTGITVNSSAYTSATSMSTNITVDPAAPLGARTLTVTNLDKGISAGTTFNVFAGSAPTVTAINVATVGQGATAVPFTITGTNFVSGATVTFSGTNVTVDSGSLTYPDATHISGTLTVATGATVGARTITVLQPDTQTGISGSLLTVVVRPVVTTAAPATILAGSTATNVVLTGTGFASGAAVSFSGTGITVNSTTFTSATSLTANITVDAAAAVGARTLTVTNADKGYSAGTTFTVYGGSAPTVTAITPAIVGPGASAVPFTITGTNLASGATVTFSGSNVAVVSGSLTYPNTQTISGTLTATSAATTGARTITVTLPDTQTVTTVSTPVLTVSGPSLTASTVAMPNPVPRGATANQTLTIAINGLGFVNGSAVTIGGTGVTVNATTFVDANNLTASITIAAGATVGSHTLTVTNPDGGYSTTTGTFYVFGGAAPTIATLSPTTLTQGATSIPFVLTGSNFVPGATVAVSGSNVTVGSVAYISPTQLAGILTVSTTATTGLRDVTVTLPDSQTVTSTALFTVDGRITSVVSPVSALQGATLDVVIGGSGFVNGSRVVFSGTDPNIVVNSVTYNNMNKLTANITIAATAATGTRTVSVINPDGVTFTSGSVFNVLNATTTPLVYIRSITPNQVSAGVSSALIDIYGSGFATGATVSFSGSRVSTASPITATFVDSTHLQVTIATATGSAQASNVTVLNTVAAGSGTDVATSGFYVNAVPTIATLNITGGAIITGSLRGTAFDMSFNGSGFQSGATVAFPANSGITLSNVTVVTGELITAHVVVDALAPIALQTITITNPDFGVATTTFNVSSLTSPTIDTISPSTLGQGATNVNVTITGSQFVTGAVVTLTQAGVATNFTVNSTQVVSATQIIANVTVNTSATTGTNNTVITVTNPSNESAQQSLMSIVARPGSTTITPTSAALGSTLNIAFTSSGLLSGSGFGVTVSGTGVTVNSTTLNSATSASANVTIDANYVNAPIGARTISLINGNYGLRTATFTVLGLQQTITSASPAMRQGAVGQDLTIIGTNFFPGATVTFSNANVTQNTPVVFVDQNTLKVNISVAGTATVGTSNITVLNADGKTVTGTGFFSVVAGPTVTSNTPSSGGQGETLTVTITGTDFDAVAPSGVVFSGAGITVNSVSGSGTTLVANVTVDSAAVLTSRFITVTNLDGSSASGGSFVVTPPNATTTGKLTFYGVSTDTITVKADYLNDGGNLGSCVITYGTTLGSYPNTLAATRSGSSFVATATGLVGGADGAGKNYFFQATFSNPAGVSGTNPLVAAQSTSGSPLVHNNLNTNSVQWSEGWGITDGKYGAISCTTCHSKTTSNRKLVAGVFNAANGSWDSTGTSSLTVIYDNTTQLGTDDNHGTSTKACEACHTKTNHHRYNNVAANHEGSVDCITCHSHKEAFVPNCSVCHSSTQGARRAIIGTNGDFFTNKSSSHGLLVGSNSQACAVCHASTSHKNGAVVLKNADTGATVVFDRTTSSAAALKNVCLSCHDSNGAAVYGTNALSPFAAAGDKKSPTNITQYWAPTGGAHDVKMVCMNCHGNSQATTDTLKYNIHASGKKKILQDAGYDVLNPNNYCFNCHNSASVDANKSSKNISGEFALTNKHVTARCFDCHGDENNSLDSMHSLRAGTQTVGSGVIAKNLSNATGRSMTWSTSSWSGASAVNTLASNTVTAEYQICFKCHAALGTGTSPEINNAAYTGAGALTNLALEFNPNNASGHPVVTGLKNYPNSALPKELTAVKMKAPWNVNLGTQVMTCSDCHATDSAASKGPHGSSVKWMLAGTNKAWPYTAASANGSSSSSGTFFRIATYTTGNGTVNGLFCLNCHVVTGTNNWHSNSDITGGQHGAGTTGPAVCVNCHVRVPHGGKIARLLQTTNAPARYRANGSSGTPLFTQWGPTTGTIKGSTMSSANFNSSCSEHSGSGGEAW